MKSWVAYTTALIVPLTIIILIVATVSAENPSVPVIEPTQNHDLLYSENDYSPIAEPYQRIPDFDFDPANTGASGFSVEKVAQIGGRTVTVQISGSYAYLGVGSRLYIFDVTKPNEPTVLSELETFVIGKIRPNSIITDIAIDGDYAYVIVANGYLYVVNVSTPTSPEIVGLVDTPAYFWGGLAANNGHVYVAAGSSLRIIDVSNPAAPSEVSYYYASSDGVFVVGDYAYLAHYAGGLTILDISSPDSPQYVGKISIPSARKVEVVGDYAYVSNYDSPALYVIDISAPSTPVVVGTLDTLDNGWDLTVDGSYAYVAADHLGMRVIDISNPISPTEVSTYDPGGNTWDIAVEGDYAYVANHDMGLRIVNIATPSNPIEVGSWGTFPFAWDVAVSGGFAYVSEFNNGMDIIDISTESDPKLVVHFESDCYSLGVAYGDEHVYLACTGDGLRIIDVSDVNNPIEVGVSPGYAGGKPILKSNYVFVPGGSEGLRIIDVSAPASPIKVGSFITPTHALSIAGNNAYIAAGEEGLIIIDVSNVYSPTLVGSYDTPGFATDVAIKGNYAYIADNKGGLRIIDISLPDNPTEVSKINTNIFNGVSSVDILGNYAVYIDYAFVIYVDILLPDSPKVLFGTMFWSNPNNTTIDGDWIYVTTIRDGLVILKASKGPEVYLPFVTHLK